MCPVKAIGCCYVHITSSKHKPKIFLSTYWVDGDRYDMTDADVRSALKHAARVLNYQDLKGIPIDRICTRSL